MLLQKSNLAAIQYVQSFPLMKSQESLFPLNQTFKENTTNKFSFSRINQSNLAFLKHCILHSGHEKCPVTRNDYPRLNQFCQTNPENFNISSLHFDLKGRCSQSKVLAVPPLPLNHHIYNLARITFSKNYDTETFLMPDTTHPIHTKK